jgi:hypothetical protein
VNEIETTTATMPADPHAGRDWLKLYGEARNQGGSLEPPQRERSARLRARADAAYFAAETRRDYEDYRERHAEWLALQRRADDLDDGRHVRPYIVEALIRRDGGVEAFIAREAANLTATWPGVTALGLAQREALEAHRRWIIHVRIEALEAEEQAARAEVARLEEASSAWCRGRAEHLVRQAIGGDAQAIFRLFPQDLAIELTGPLPALCAYLADLEDFPDD